MDYKKLALELFESVKHKRKKFTMEPPLDVSKGEIGILSYLSFEKNNIYAGDLVDIMNLSSGRIAIAIKSLEKKGYVKRYKDIDDKRKVVVSATTEGEKYARVCKKLYINNVAKIFESIGENDAKELIRILKKIQNNAN